MKSKKDKIDFIGIGSAKSGSSWLATCLIEHPQVNLPKEKSLFFFNADYGNEYIKDNWSYWSKGIDWYLSKFPPVEKGKIRGEFGVSYLHDPEAPQRIKDNFPDTKILVTLRNPCDMLYSLYWYNVNTVEAKVPETFEEAVKTGWCIDRGNYYKYLRRFFDLFPRKNIHVVIFDDIRNEPERVAFELYKFLEVDTSFKPSILDKKIYSAIGHRFWMFKQLGYYMFAVLRILKLEKVRRFLIDNPIFYAVYAKLNVVPKKYPPMEDGSRNKLRKVYRKDIKKLEKLVKHDLSAWL